MRVSAHLKTQRGFLRIQSGFTLIELIIVIAALGMLVTALLTVVNPIEQFKKSRDTKRKSSLAQIQRAIESYYQDHGSYPASSPDYKIISDANGSTTTITWGSSWLPYMDKLPEDPVSGQSFVYYNPGGTGQTYYLYASLERGASDPNVCNNGNTCTSLPSGGSPCGVGKICNFGISSPDVQP